MATVHCFTCLLYLSREPKEQWCCRCCDFSARSVCDVIHQRLWLCDNDFWHRTNVTTDCGRWFWRYFEITNGNKKIQRSGFSSRPFFLGFVLEIVVLEQIFDYSSFSNHCHSTSVTYFYICHLPIIVAAWSFIVEYKIIRQIKKQRNGRWRIRLNIFVLAT